MVAPQPSPFAPGSNLTTVALKAVALETETIALTVFAASPDTATALSASTLVSTRLQLASRASAVASRAVASLDAGLLASGAAVALLGIDPYGGASAAPEHFAGVISVKRIAPAPEEGRSEAISTLYQDYKDL